MKKYIAKRLLMLIFVLFAAATVVFFLLHLVPGDPVTKILGEGANPEDVRRLRQELHLDQPLLAQYLEFVKNLPTLGFGTSVANSRGVISNILEYFPNTLYLALAAMTIALVVSLPLGALAAFKQNTLVDSSVTLVSSVGLAIPNFVLAPLLIIAFSIQLGWLPVSGSEGFKYIVLPALTLGTSMSAFLTRIFKTKLAEQMKEPYVVLARAKGLSEFAVFRKHVLKNALVPVVTTMGMQFGTLLAGAVITETIFSWQGIGLLLVDSIRRRDYPMIQGLIVCITFFYLLTSFLVDLCYHVLDPRIRYEKKGS